MSTVRIRPRLAALGLLLLSTQASLAVKSEASRAVASIHSEGGVGRQSASFAAIHVVSDATVKYNKELKYNWQGFAYDDSTWSYVTAPSGGLCNESVVRRIAGSTAKPVWGQNPVAHETIYVRKVFRTNTPTAAYLKILADDDFDLFINGELAVSDWNGVVTDWEGDVTEYMRSGQNVLAFRVRDSFGGCQSLQFDISLVSDVQEFLELPFADRGLPFSYLVSDQEIVGGVGTVTSYFDHMYPDYGKNGRVVTFHGYDSGDLDVDPGFQLAYDGHPAIDFVPPFPAATVDVLAAADGIITHIVPASTGTCICDDSGTPRPISEHCLGNNIVISHPNGYATTYGHLANFDSEIAEGQHVTIGTRLGAMGQTGCSFHGPHIHFEVANGAGVVVDPFGWMPFPDSSYGRSGAEDPWKVYQKTLSPPQDGTSHYLWIHRLDVGLLNTPNVPTVVSDKSGTTTATFPVDAILGPFRVEIWDSLNSPAISAPSARPLASFALYAFNQDEAPIWSLFEPVQIEFEAGSPTEGASSQDPRVPSFLMFHWDDAAGAWLPQETTYDAPTGVVSSSSFSLGRFAVAEVLPAVFLPLVSR